MALAGALVAACRFGPRAMPAPVAPHTPAPSRPAADPVAPAYETVRRSAWGAAPLRANHDPMDGVLRITVHHTDTLDRMDERTEGELVRAIQRYHQDGRGWADIGYHFVIGRDGKVYQGRRLDVQGAHAGAGNNGNNLGVSLIGRYVDVLPGERQLAALDAFLRDCMARHDVRIDQVFGHRDFAPTQCPGDALYAWLLVFKREAGR